MTVELALVGSVLLWAAVGLALIAAVPRLSKAFGISALLASGSTLVLAIALVGNDFSLAYVGFEVLAPFVAYGVEAGIRYSDPTAVETRLKGILDSFGAAFGDLDTRPMIPFNRKAEWGADGRIVPVAPVYSPFIRRKEKLDLE